jgi:hypothetical protein
VRRDCSIVIAQLGRRARPIICNELITAPRDARKFVLVRKVVFNFAGVCLRERVPEALNKMFSRSRESYFQSPFSFQSMVRPKGPSSASLLPIST